MHSRVKRGVVFAVVIMAAVMMKAPQSLQSHRVAFYDEELFFQGALQFPAQKNHVRARGGIVPHHLLASPLIAEFFAGLDEPATIILIGPNHEDRGRGKILTSAYRWRTAFGDVEPDDALIKRLLDSPMIDVDEASLELEHSVVDLMPYIKYYMPQARVVPIIFSSKLSEDELDRFSELIARVMQGSTMLIASVDFSHYLSSAVAEQKDRETLMAMNRRDYPAIMRLGSDHLDSPASIVLLLKAMETQGARMQPILRHTNSSLLQHADYRSTTSYFTVYFTK